MVAKELGIYGNGVTDTGHKIIADYLKDFSGPDQKTPPSGAFKGASELTNESNYKEVKGVVKGSENIIANNVSDSDVRAFEESNRGTQSSFAEQSEKRISDLDSAKQRLSGNFDQKVLSNEKVIQDTKQAIEENVDDAENSRISNKIVGRQNPNTNRRQDGSS